jgi:hypothetical protein
MSVHVPQLRFRPTPFMAEWIHKIAVREGRSQASVMNTLILEAIYKRLQTDIDASDAPRQDRIGIECWKK